MKPPLPVMTKMCPTCPFRTNGWTDVRDLLIQRLLNEGTPVCHSTGPRPLSKRIHRKQHACRGARNMQLELFYALGVLPEPTDAAWSHKANQLNESAPQSIHSKKRDTRR